MELKLEMDIEDATDELLLIVPYGIETSKLPAGFGLSYLLIVPYGIETKQEDSSYLQALLF